MDPTDRQDGPARPADDRAKAKTPVDRRAEALRANLKRRKAQGRGRAEAERADRQD